MSIQPLRRDPRLPAVPRSRPGVIPAPKRASSCVVVDELGIKTYPSLYLWNQPSDEGNHTPAWDTFNIVVDKK